MLRILKLLILYDIFKKWECVYKGIFFFCLNILLSIELGFYFPTKEINSVPLKKKKNGTVVTFILRSYRESKDL